MSLLAKRQCDPLIGQAISNVNKGDCFVTNALSNDMSRVTSLQPAPAAVETAPEGSTRLVGCCRAMQVHDDFLPN